LVGDEESLMNAARRRDAPAIFRSEECADRPKEGAMSTVPGNPPIWFSLSISALGFIRRMAIAFGLLVFIPLLVLIYVHMEGANVSFATILFSTAVTSLVGFYVVWEIVKRILTLAQDAQRLVPAAATAQQGQQDEGGILQQSFSHLIQQMQSTMAELEAKAGLLEETEQKLGEATVYSAQVISSIADYVIVTDSHMRVRKINPAVQTQLGYGVDDLKDRPVETVLRGTAGGEVLMNQEEMAQLMRAGTLWGKSGMLRSRDGEGIPVQMNLSLVRGADGDLSGIVIVARDVRETLRLVADLQQAKTNLEERVRQRTQQIEQAMQERERAYQELTRKDDQLVRQEKMASLGQLAAGVAHEINNPVGFVSSNLQMLQRYLADLTTYAARTGSLMEKLRGGANTEVLRPEAEEVAGWVKSVELDQTLVDAGESVVESIDGLNRVKKIVSALREFSHADRDEPASADLNEGLESTINIVWNELKYKITLHREYGDLPKVNCYPHQLNQVFMNLLVNAAHAIPDKGEVWVKTWADRDRVYVDVRDTGAGIPEANLSKIFDPFFTTKPVGQGTGLGLSIVYGIVERHGGTIHVESRVGEGTTFHLSFPLQPVLKAAA
jgi:PAS domain S-box-containing protein